MHIYSHKISAWTENPVDTHSPFDYMASSLECFFNVSTLFVLRNSAGSLFHSSTTLFPYQFILISLQRYIFASLNQWNGILFTSLNFRTLLISPLLIPLTHLKTSINSSLTLHLSKNSILSPLDHLHKDGF